jgi:hypothetical protein
VASRGEADEPAQLRAAARALSFTEDRLKVVARNDFYGVFCENGAGGVAVVDRLASVALAEHAKRVLADEPDVLMARLGDELRSATVNLGVATLLPRVTIVSGASIVDLSDARRPEDILAGARTAVEGRGGPAVAVIWG